MALRAGYYGIKKKLLDSIIKFMTDSEGAKIIKTIGSGLTLDSDGSLSADSQKVNYSLTEQNTGIKWYDGRDIYQKTIEFGALPNNDIKTVAHNISDFDVGWIYDGYAKSLSSETGFTNMLSLCVPTALASGWYTAVTNTNIEIRTGSDRSGYSAVVTIRYVKTVSNE